MRRAYLRMGVVVDMVGSILGQLAENEEIDHEKFVLQCTEIVAAHLILAGMVGKSHKEAKTLGKNSKKFKKAMEEVLEDKREFLVRAMEEFAELSGTKIVEIDIGPEGKTLH